MRCDVCPRGCTLEEGKIGFCRARKNVGGRSVSVNYGKLVSIALDPIEKKPLARFHPGSKILSVGTFGCNMDCLFCQNHSIAAASEEDVRTRYVSPSELARLAGEMKDKGNIGVAFTYNEPMIGYEYVRDVSVETKKMGMKNVVVTNGCVLPDILDRVLPWVDAFNIDLKSFSEETYRKLGGDLKTVKDFIICAAKRSHVEITTLIVPGMNESEEEIKALSGWIAGIEKSIPLHITRFFPQRKMSHCMPTDIDLLGRLFDTAKKNLDNVFIGNV